MSRFFDSISGRSSSEPFSTQIPTIPIPFFGSPVWTVGMTALICRTGGTREAGSLDCLKEPPGDCSGDGIWKNTGPALQDSLTQRQRRLWSFTSDLCFRMEWQHHRSLRCSHSIRSRTLLPLGRSDSSLIGTLFGSLTGRSVHTGCPTLSILRQHPHRLVLRLVMSAVTLTTIHSRI